MGEEQSLDQPSKSTTVQVLAFHPFNRTSILMVHNLLEDQIANISMYNGRPKPAGWGNPGGGMEPDELDRLRLLDPLHPILRDPDLNDDDRQVLACGLRELSDESGFYNLTLKPLPDGEIALNTHQYSNGHRVVTVWGEIESLARRPIREFNEVDSADWFDFSIPLPRLFFDQAKHPGHPYWSHIRRIFLSLIRIDVYNREHDIRATELTQRIHPSWRTVFSIGKGDERFPALGYLIPPERWYDLFGAMIRERLEMLNRDLVFELFKKEITDIVRKEKEAEAEQTPTVPPVLDAEEVVEEDLVALEEVHYDSWRRFAEDELKPALDELAL